jgi:hypothetical protein
MIELSGGRNSLDHMLDAYDTAWQDFIAANSLQSFIESALATTIGWKVDSQKALFENLEQLAGGSEQMHIGTVNNRFIATVVLIKPFREMRLIKILVRRSGSNDPLGLDSIDYLVENLTAVSEQLAKSNSCTLQKDHNDLHSWLSLRFGTNREFEAKFTDHLVLEVAQKEMALSEKEILRSLGID